MGVPGLAAYINEKSPGCVVTSLKGEKVVDVDITCVDFNGLIHGNAQKVYGYGAHERVFPNDEFDDLSENEKLVKVFEMSFNDIVTLVKTLPPSKILFIAIDGPAPLAKQTQQRMRRFLAARGRSGKEFDRLKGGQTKFDSNNITAGTLFMHELYKYCKARIREEMMTNPEWKKLMVYFSPPNVPGEGEHKLLEWLRHQKPANVGIYSPDGDLIMLSLALEHHNVTLVRNNFQSDSHYDVINIGKIVTQISKFDFIFVGFYVGNDFLPRIVAFDSLDKGIDTMIHIIQHNKLNLIKHGKLNVEDFRKFVEIMARREHALLTQQISSQPADSLYTFKTLLDSTDKGVLHYGKFRKMYYAKGNIDASDKEEVAAVCESYIETLVWTFEYYTKGLPQWDLYYPYWYAPLLTDLCEYVTNNPCDFKFVRGEPSSPFLQLACVLPRESASVMLPEEYFDAIKDNDEMYENTFHVDLEGKKKDHEGVAQVTFVDRGKIRKVIDAVKPKRLYLRNVIGKHLIFYHSLADGEEYHYKTKYCQIHKCNIQITRVDNWVAKNGWDNKEIGVL